MCTPILRSSFAALAALLLAPAPAAQGPQSAAAPGTPARQGPPAAVAGRSCGMTTVAGEPVAAGARYRARFSAGGIEFTPALGKAAPRSLPLCFTLLGIARGATQLLDATAAATADAVLAGDQVDYDRGHGVVERYQARADGVEQSFTFASRPAGSGDLVLRGRIATELAPVPMADGSLRFCSGDLGGVRFGAVTGIDARGDRAAGSLRCAGDTLELVLPAAFVDAASYPLVLDPLLGAEVAVNSGGDERQADVAYDATTDLYLVVWRHVLSASDSDVHGQRVRGDGTLVGGLVLIALTGSIELHARVADVAASDRFLVVWQQGASMFGPWDVAGCAVTASSGAVSPVITIAGTANDEIDPCVSGEATQADNEAIVVWKDEGGGILACEVTVAIIGAPLALLPVTLTSSFLASKPCISKTGGAIGRHPIAWQQAALAGDSEIIVVARTRDLVAFGAVAGTSNALDDILPSVDGDGTDFLLVWAQAEAGGSARHDVKGMHLRCTATTLAAASGEFDLAVDGLDDETAPDVAFLGPHFVVVWQDEGPTALTDDIEGKIVTVDGLTSGVRFVCDGTDPTANHTYESQPRAIGQRSGNAAGTSDQGLIVFGEALSLPPFTGQIVMQRVEAVGPGGVIASVGPGCGNGGTAGVNGPFAVGNTQLQITLSGADPAALATFLGIALPGPPVPGGSCLLTNNAVHQFKPIAGGAASSAYPLPLSTVYVGITLEFQWVTLGTASSPWPQVPGLAASNRMQCTLGL